MYLAFVESPVVERAVVDSIDWGQQEMRMLEGTVQIPALEESVRLPEVAFLFCAVLS